MSYSWGGKPEEPAERQRDWSPAGFVLTVVGSTIFGALLAELLLDTETVGHPVKRGVHAFEDWLLGFGYIVAGNTAFFLIAFCYALHKSKRFTGPQ